MILAGIVALASFLSVVSAAACSVGTSTVVSTKTIYITASSTTTSLATTGSTKITSTTSVSTTTTSLSPTASLYGQCGGTGYTGPTICAPGSTCIYSNPFFSQCLPGSSTAASVKTTSTTSAPKSSTSTSTSKSIINTTSVTSVTSVTSTTPTTPTTSAPTTTGPPIKTVPIYGQCGGTGFTGPTVCAPGLICVKENDFFSNCFPGPDYTPSPTPTPSVTTTITYPPKQTFNYLFSFGDDFSITGFNLSGTKPSDDNQLGNPAYPGITTTGGMNWIDRIITNNVGLLSYNFASAGATIDSTVTPPNGTNVLSLVDQVTEFTSNLAPPPAYAPWNSSLSLFVVWIGMHDVGAAYDDPNWPAISETLIDSYFTQAQILYNAGARFFAFGSIPPLQRAPAMLLQSVASQQAEATAISIFNTMQANSAQAFLNANPGVYVEVIDMQEPFNVMLDSPTVYGAPNASCYNPDGVSCLWWNEYYPGFNISTFCGDAISVIVGLYL